MNVTATMKTLTFGTELEYTGINRQRAAIAIQSIIGGEITHAGGSYDEWNVTAPDGRVWKAVTDGSLGSRDNSAEIVTPILRYDDIATLQEVVRALRHAGAKATRETSQHVHVGATQMNGKQLANLAKSWAKYEPLILAAVGTHQHRLDHYTKPCEAAFVERLQNMRPTTREELNVAWFGRSTPNPSHYDHHRYRALNLNNLWRTGTVEFRLFNSTTHAGEVRAHIILCLAVVAKAMLARSASCRNQRTPTAATGKYDMRVYLLSLGLSGDEFKNVRMHLLKRLSGDSAWRRATRAA